LLKPDKDVTQNGDHFVIKTISTFKNYDMDFVVGQEFEEDLGAVDGRKCMVSVPTIYFHAISIIQKYDYSDGEKKMTRHKL